MMMRAAAHRHRFAAGSLIDAVDLPRLLAFVWAVDLL
jgi:hypothetical protein